MPMLVKRERYLLIQQSCNQKGVVLVTALLYLLVITCLVESAFSSGILQTKISEHLYQSIQAFENAESALLKAEQAILIDQVQNQGEIDVNTHYEFHQLPRSECGLFYQVNVITNVAASKIQLRSVFVFPMAGLNPCVEISNPHRVMWQWLNG